MSASRFFTGLAAAAAASVIAAALPVSAAPALSPLKPLSLEQSIVQKTHGWHRKCRHGWSDVHKHVRGVGRITCQTHRCWVQNGVQKCGWF